MVSTKAKVVFSVPSLKTEWKKKTACMGYMV